MNLLEDTLRIGAERPFTFLHLSDTHLTRADNRNDERKLRLAKDRRGVFPQAEDVLAQAVRTARTENLPLFFTGDLIDFVSYANLDRVRELTRTQDVFFAAGNHEFSLYVGEAKEDAAYRAQSLDLVQSAFTNDIRFSSRVWNGVNFVAIDNGYYLIEQEQLDRLYAETKKGLPIVLMMHTPLHTDRLYAFMRDGEAKPAYLMGTPEDLLADYPPERIEQQRPDAVTREACDFIRHAPCIKAILAGHIHRTIVDELRPGLYQWIVGCTDVRKLHVI